MLAEFEVLETISAVVRLGRNQRGLEMRPNLHPVLEGDEPTSQISQVRPAPLDGGGCILRDKYRDPTLARYREQVEIPRRIAGNSHDGFSLPSVWVAVEVLEHCRLVQALFAGERFILFG